MPPFGGFNLGNIGGALARNEMGDIAQRVLPRSAFGGFGLDNLSAPVGQQRLQQTSASRRASLRPKPAAKARVYGNGLLSPLAATDGLIWPYTPTISYNHNINYQPVATVHANQDYHVYTNTPAVELQVNGDFTVQNQREGQYALAAIHFLRTMAKMNFGDKDPNAGTPPPVLLFDAYGAFVFKDLPVIIKSFQVEFPDNVDYVEVGVSGINREVVAGRERLVLRQSVPESFDAGGTPAIPELVLPGTPDIVQTAPQSYTVWLPSVFKISVNLVVQHTPKTLRSRFELPKFVNGDNTQKDFI
jgi:hypothetical protein